MSNDYDNAEALASQFEKRLASLGSAQRPHDGGGRGRGGRGGRGGGRGSSGQSRESVISHALSRLLRHQATAAGIPLDAQGYARLDLVLQWPPLRSVNATVAEVRRVVATNDKQRFRLRDADGGDVAPGDGDDDARDAATLYIRANQGHSIATLASDAGLLTPLTDPATAPATVCHGTYLAAWPAIEAAGGLHRMGRNHVHFGCLPADGHGHDDDKDKDKGDGDAGGGKNKKPAGRAAVIPGVRRDAQLLVFVNVRRALGGGDGGSGDAGLRWWRAANDVVLTEGDASGLVPTRLFARVVVTAAGAHALRAAGIRPVPCAAAGAPPPPSDAPLPPFAGEGFVLWQDGQKLADLPHEALAAMALPNGKRRAAGPGRGSGGSRGGLGRGG